MRTIKFRGKSRLDGRWLFGDLFRTDLDGGVSIQTYDEVDGWMTEDVNEKTVGQFTSLFDRNKKEIYEGDIIRINDDESGVIEVRFVRGVFAFLWNGDLDEELPINAPTHEWAEIIGNIHDNPELLKGGAQ